MRRPPRTPKSTAALLVAVAVLLAGCGSAAAGRRSGDRTVTVFAAASLTEAFTRIAHDFEATHPGVRVALSFGGSSTLAQQIVNGAPADVFAAASPTTMAIATRGVRTATSPRTFARNTLVLAVPAANPGHVGSVADLTRAGVTLAECAPEVPCGALAAEALAGIQTHPVTLEQDVKAVLTKVELGEVDAGTVYRSDARVAAAKVRAIELPGHPSTSYPLVVVRDSSLAREFADAVMSPAGQRVLAAAGFDRP